MPIIKSAKKALRGSQRKRIFNLRVKKAYSATVKNFKRLVLENKLSEAEELIPQVYKTLDKAAKRGVIKANTSARKKSRLTAYLRAKKS